MSATDKLQVLISRCKGAVYISVNEHRNCYDSVEQHLANMPPRTDDIDPDVREKMIQLDTVVEVQFYPLTPVGFHVVYHHDLDAALDEALACLSK